MLPSDYYQFFLLIPVFSFIMRTFFMSMQPINENETLNSKKKITGLKNLQVLLAILVLTYNYFAFYVICNSHNLAYILSFMIVLHRTTALAIKHNQDLLIRLKNTIELGEEHPLIEGIEEHGEESTLKTYKTLYYIAAYFLALIMQSIVSFIMHRILP